MGEKQMNSFTLSANIAKELINDKFWVDVGLGSSNSIYDREVKMLQERAKVILRENGYREELADSFLNALSHKIEDDGSVTIGVEFDPVGLQNRERRYNA
jgi:hypothetical protein